MNTKYYFAKKHKKHLLVISYFSYQLLNMWTCEVEHRRENQQCDVIRSVVNFY